MVEHGTENAGVTGSIPVLATIFFLVHSIAEGHDHLLNYINFLAGIALMLLGIRSLRNGADRYFGVRFRQLIQDATKSRLRAFVTGFGVSILTPSSTAVALLAVESINAGYANLPQMLALMLGANIGFTITVQLLAFKFYVYSGFFIVPGAAIYLFAKRAQTRGGGLAILGVGILLLAIQMLSMAVAPMQQNNDVLQIIHILENHPVLLALMGLLLQVVLQSSTTTIGLGIVLCAQHVLRLEAALVIVLGANIGIAITALIAGYKHIDTRRMAVGNLSFKLIGALAMAPLLPWISRLLEPISMAGETHDTQLIANVHTFLNLGIAIVFLPLVPSVSGLLEKLMPKTEDSGAEQGARYLDPSALISPALALGQATREILHMADHVRSMLRDSRRTFENGDELLCTSIQDHDDIVDQLNNEIKTYVTKIAEQALKPEESRREIALLAFAGELENVGDIIDKNLMELAKKKMKLRVKFSAEGKADLDSFYDGVLENFELAVSAFATQDRELATQLVQRKHLINERERELRDRHFHRLHAGLPESFETSSIHLDVLMNLKHINSLLSAVAYPILEPKSA